MRPRDQFPTNVTLFEERSVNEVPSASAHARTAIAIELEALASRLRNIQADVQEYELDEASSVSIAKNLIQARLEANELLGELSLRHGPALDILLDLFVNLSNAKLVSMTEASIAGRVAPTTGLRWVKLLIHAGLVERSDDPTDQRRSFIGLTAKGFEITLNCIQAFSKV